MSELKEVFIVDVEATCWATKEEQANRPNEIIEIGICRMDVKTGEIHDASGYIVKPRFTTVSQFCTDLTGWKQSDMDDGVDILPTLAAVQSDYGLTKDHIWFSCGHYDKVKLGCHGRGSLGDLYGIRHDQNVFESMKHFNIKTLFALKHKLKREMGMERMLQHIGAVLEGRHHNGADDAYNIAKLVQHVLK